jgi:dipeptidyl aminopeptidase/acylaminoacyl peptidase
LIAHGGRDVRVSPAQSEEMVRALRARGVAVPYLTYPEEGHGFSKEENTLHFFRTLENFLALHLGSKVEAPTPVRLTP